MADPGSLDGDRKADREADRPPILPPERAASTTVGVAVSERGIWSVVTASAAVLPVRILVRRYAEANTEDANCLPPSSPSAGPFDMWSGFRDLSIEQVSAKLLQHADGSWAHGMNAVASDGIMKRPSNK